MGIVCMKMLSALQYKWSGEEKKMSRLHTLHFIYMLFFKKNATNDCFLFSSLPLLLHVIVMVKKVWLLSPLLVISSWNDSLFKSSQCTLFGMAYRHRHTSHFTLIIIFLLPSHHSLQGLLNMYVNTTWWWRHGDLLSTAAALLSALILFPISKISAYLESNTSSSSSSGNTTKHHFSHFLSRKIKHIFHLFCFSVWSRISNG